ncbi:hypothetical protein [Ruminococcus sp.]|uniref:hypothetical protein n=1 Tax=Ruminococcus sp. TaxID=41978 RepID=UPI002E793CCD|nr:hypothetical protein [Ruminococcus sp.]MEE1396798.1 hypothetical protein [Ruminococcus sp.]
MGNVSDMFHRREIDTGRGNYYTKVEIDARVTELQGKDAQQDGQIGLLEQSSHSHANKGILDATEAAYTADKDKKLIELEDTDTTYTLARKAFATKFDDVNTLLYVKYDKSGTLISTSNIDIRPTFNAVGTALLTSGKGYLPILDSRYETRYGDKTDTDAYIKTNPQYTSLLYVDYTYDGSTEVRYDNTVLVVKMPVEATRFIGANATAEQQGLMAPEDKEKLDSFDSSAWVVGGSMEISGAMTANLPDKQSFVGSYKNTANGAWYDVISIRHRNGYDDGNQYGMSIYSALTSAGDLMWNKQISADKWQGVRTLLDSTNYSSYAAKSSHTHEMIVNNSKLIVGSNGAAQWYRLGTLTSFENFSTAVISVWSGNGANGNASQNSWFEIHIKDGWQSTQSATKACGVTVYRTRCGTVKVKVIPTAHNTFTVWVYLPWPYWNGNYAVNGRYKTWTTDSTHQTAEPEGTGADTAYYDKAFLTSTVAKSTEATVLTETAWTDVPTDGADSTSERELKYLVMGNTVYVQGYLKFSVGNNNPKCGTLPSGARPNDTLYFTGWDPASGVPTAYPIVVNEAGIIMLLNPTATAYWFKSGRAYRFNFSYHIG